MLAGPQCKATRKTPSVALWSSKPRPGSRGRIKKASLRRELLPVPGLENVNFQG